MQFNWLLRKFFLFLCLVTSLGFNPRASAASTLGSSSSFVSDWGFQREALGALLTPKAGEVCSLRQFREAKLILDTAVSVVRSCLDRDAGGLRANTQRSRFNWQSSLLDPLKLALTKLETMKNAVDMSLGVSSERAESLLTSHAVRYMLPQIKIDRVRAKTKAVNKMLRLAKLIKSKKTSETAEEIDDEVPALEEGCSYSVSDSVDVVHADDVFFEEIVSESSASVDLDREFAETNDAVAFLERDILALIAGRTFEVRPSVVTESPRLAVLHPTRKLVMSVDDALIRLHELKPELEAIAVVLSDAIKSMCREFSRRMPQLILERAFLEAVTGLGDATLEARRVLELTDGAK